MTPSGIEPATLRFVAQHLNHCAIAVVLTKYYSDDQIKNNGMRGACSTYGERKDAYKILVGKRDGKRPLIDQEDNTKTVFKERDGEAWTRLIWLRAGSVVGVL